MWAVQDFLKPARLMGGIMVRRLMVVSLALIAFLGFALSTSNACDTWVAVGNSTADGSVILAKNSDRPSPEAQPLRYWPRMKHARGKMVQMAHIEIPQVGETYAHIGSNIWWMPGYEHGMNEFGVGIGNEAVWSKEPYAETGLLGMDMIRLALERSKTAYEAMHVIIDLLAEYGQGGGCEYPGMWDENSTYHNSFIIADPTEAWVLETGGKYWVAKKVEDVWAISNVYSIEEDFDEMHPALISHAIEMGWCKSEADFNFTRCYSDFNVGYAGNQNRAASNRCRLEENKGAIDVEFMMNYMNRNHHEGTINESRWGPNESFFVQPCMHEIPKVCPYRTAASMVCHLRKDMPDMLRQVYWASYCVPCVNVFKPFYFHGGQVVSEEFSKGTYKYDKDSPWWWASKTKRLCDLNYRKLAPVAIGVFRETEKWELAKSKTVEAEALKLIKKGKKSEAAKLLADFTQECLDRTAKEYKMVHGVLEKMVPVVGVDFIWIDFLKKNCETAGLTLPGLK